MPAPGFLHDHPNFVDLLRQLAQQTGIATYLIEKDYWLMHGLWVLQQQGWQFQLKGGTSLSKGFGIIQRFSEDIDLRIEPPAEQQVKAGKNQDKPAHIETRRQYFDWLAAEIGTRALPGFESVEHRVEGPTEVCELVAAVDQRLAADVAADCLRHPRDLQPLPLLGIPGLTPESEDPAFYEDTWQFRPGRRRLAATPQES